MTTEKLGPNTPSERSVSVFIVANQCNIFVNGVVIHGQDKLQKIKVLLRRQVVLLPHRGKSQKHGLVATTKTKLAQ